MTPTPATGEPPDADPFLITCEQRKQALARGRLRGIDLAPACGEIKAVGMDSDALPQDGAKWSGVTHGCVSTLQTRTRQENIRLKGSVLYEQSLFTGQALEFEKKLKREKPAEAEKMLNSRFKLEES